jgi:hypothetical protein
MKLRLPLAILLTHLVTFSFVLTSATLVSNCATLVTSLPVIIAAVQDGSMVVDTIARFVELYFAKHGDKSPVDPEKVRTAIERTRMALNAALRAAQGAEKLDQAQVDAAFADFKQAYIELTALVAPLGVRTGDKLSARPGGLSVPEPMALKLRVN